MLRLFYTFYTLYAFFAIVMSLVSDEQHPSQQIGRDGEGAANLRLL